LFVPGDPGGGDWPGRIGAVGWDCRPLLAPASGLRAWIDQPHDAFVIAPFGGWEEPASMVTLARAIAASRPLMVLAPDGCVEARLVALQAGADDVIGIGADGRELAARLRGLLRRHRLAGGRIECADLAIDLIERRVTRGGRLIRLPLREYDLLANLARVPDRIVPRLTLLRAVWKIDFDPGTNRVEVHMSRLRSKLDRGFDWPMLMTARGQGYGLRSRQPDRSGA
jgi:two-component system, OmpR family, response regulator